MRTIQQREYDLLAGLLSRLDVCPRSVRLSPDLLVEELRDGGMGSVRFHYGRIAEENRRFGAAILEGQFHDHDGTLVSVTVNVDDQGRLYELDLWKVDFSPTTKFPAIDDMEEVRHVSNGGV